MKATERIKAQSDRFTSRGRAWARFVAQRLILKPFIWSVTEVTVTGRESLSAIKGAYVLVCNHTSHLDAPLLICAVPRRMGRFLAAGAAADYFFSRWWKMALTRLFFNAFPVDRTGTVSRKGLSKSLLHRGVPLLVFPEGTRSRTGEMGPFKAGAAALSMSVRVPCVPAAIVGAYEAMPRGAAWVRPGRPPVRVSFGAPMHALPGETAEAFTARIASTIRQLREDPESRSVVEHPRKGAA